MVHPDLRVVGRWVIVFLLLHGAGPGAGRAMAQVTGRGLAGTTWRLVEFQSMDDRTGTVRPADPSRYTMRLAVDSTVAMQLDCNRAMGRWSAEPGPDPSGGRFTFSPLAGTRALCPPPSLDELVLAQAGFVRAFLLQEGRLYLSLMADGGILAWEPAEQTFPDTEVPAAPEDGGPRNFEVTGLTSRLNLREAPTTTAAVLAQFSAGTILDNLGCQVAEGRTWCDVQPLGGGPRGFVAASYLRPAVSPNGGVATGPDDSALRAGQGEFDATGRIPCAQSDDQPMRDCEFGVARAGGGYATVVVTLPGGRRRALFFRMGRPMGADTSEADGQSGFQANRHGDLHIIRVGTERYEVPDAVILGG